MSPPSFVRVDMEGSAYTERTLSLVRDLHRQPGNRGRVGAVIQSYLRRSEDDVAGLLSDGIRIRLCKGAYNEPAELPFRRSQRSMPTISSWQKCCSRAASITGWPPTTKALFAGSSTSPCRKRFPESFEFQMLYGVRRDLQQSLVRRGMAHAGLHSLWQCVVSVPDAAACRTAGQCPVHRQEFAPEMTRSPNTVNLPAAGV